MKANIMYCGTNGMEAKIRSIMVSECVLYAPGLFLFSRVVFHEKARVTNEAKPVDWKIAVKLRQKRYFIQSRKPGGEISERGMLLSQRYNGGGLDVYF